MEKEKIAWKKPNREHRVCNTCQTVKHGGGLVMLWGCIAKNDTGYVEFIDDTIDKIKYLNISKENLKSSAEKLKMLLGYCFQ